MPGFPVLQNLLERAQTHSTESVMPSKYLVLCRPLLLLPSIFPSIRVFSNELAFHIRWPKYWSFSFTISSSNEYSGLISSRIDWFDLLAVQGTLKSLLQPQFKRFSSSVFTLLYGPTLTGKTIVLTRRIFVGRVMSLLFIFIFYLFFYFFICSEFCHTLK